MADPQDRNVVEEVQYQGVDESIAYTLDVSAIGDDPSNPSVDVFLEADLATSVKDTVMPVGSPAIAGNIITLPALTSLTLGKRYRVEVAFTLDGNNLEHYFIVQAQR